MTLWAIWLLVIIVSFAILEGIALKTGKWPSLSMATWRTFQAWPLIAVIYGLLLGGLAVHFFWHWCPPGSMTGG